MSDVAASSPCSEALTHLPEQITIQQFVDRMGFDIVVVGSAARGDRRNVGKGVPLGKEIEQKSDIDYLIPLDSTPFRAEVLKSLLRAYEHSRTSRVYLLPDRDHPILIGRPRESRHRIWFKPLAEPLVLSPGTPNLEIRPWSLDHFPSEDVEFEIQRIEEFFMPTIDSTGDLHHAEILTTLDWLKSELNFRNGYSSNGSK